MIRLFKNKYIKKLYSQVGLIVALSQMLEYNLAIINAFDILFSAFDDNGDVYVKDFNVVAKKADEIYEKMQYKPLGTNIKEVKIFTKEFKDKLNDVCKRRNSVVHHIFKKDIKTNELWKNPRQKVKELEILIGDMHECNESLCRIIDEYKKEYKLIG